MDLLPVSLWSQLTARRQRSASLSQFDYGEWPPLREAIAAHVRSARGTQCSAEQVLIVAGAQAGLDLMARLLLDPGDAAWMEEPGYPGAQSALIAAGARLVPVPVDDDGLDVDAGIRRARDARLAYVTPSHQFPLGVVMSLPRRLALLKWASAAEAWVVEDDYDSEFRHGTRPVPCLHGMDVDNRVIYVGTFSKSLFPSLRLGFVIVPLDLRERLVAARRALEFQPPVLNQAVLADFMADGHYERHLRRMRAAYRERLDAMVSAAARFCGNALRVRPVLTGLHAVADLEEGDDERVAREAIARGVEAMPLSMYASVATRANGLLLGFAPIRPEDAADGMRRLAASIDAARSAHRRRASGRGAAGARLERGGMLINRTSLSQTVDAINAALFSGRKIPAAERGLAARWIAERQGLPGAYGGTFAGFPSQRSGHRPLYGERIASASARHILGEEASRALRHLRVRDPDVTRALRGADEGMMRCLERAAEEPRNGNPGLFCCGKCSVGLWRNLFAGGLDRREERLGVALGICDRCATASTSGGDSRFWYTVLALSEMDSAEARTELNYAAPALELTASRTAPSAVYARRRHELAVRTLNAL